MRVIITRHARQRHLQRTGREVDKYGLRARLRARLASGVKLTNGRVIVPVGEGLRAVCAPTVAGWVVITFLSREMVPSQRVKIDGKGGG